MHHYWLQERSHILTSLKKKAETISKRLDKIEGIKCNLVQGAMYAFPKISLPSEAIAKAEVHIVPVYYLICLQYHLSFTFLTE